MDNFKEIEKIALLHKKVVKKRKTLKKLDFFTDLWIYLLLKIVIVLFLIYPSFDVTKQSVLCGLIMFFGVFVSETIKQEKLTKFVKFKFLKDKEFEYIIYLKKKYGGLYIKRAKNHYFFLHEIRFIIQKMNYQDLKRDKQKIINLFEDKDQLFIVNVIRKIENIENKKLREQRLLRESTV